jgi:SseB protein C-terminal domain
MMPPLNEFSRQANMTWFKDTVRKLRGKSGVGEVRFFGEQDGRPERELKERLANFFQTEPAISAAYLARVIYSDKSVNVACCVRMQDGSEENVVRSVGEIFAALFGAHEHLDIIFPTHEQETELVTVCTPFSRRTLWHAKAAIGKVKNPNYTQAEVRVELFEGLRG